MCLFKAGENFVRHNFIVVTDDFMKFNHIIYIVFVLSMLSCHRELPLQSVVGFVAKGSGEQVVIVENDTLPQSVQCMIGENTTFEGGKLDEGNLVEVIYRPSENQDELPEAVVVATDATYSHVLGRWGSAAKSNPYVEFTLKPRGEIVQHVPQDVLIMRRWQLTGEEGVIEIMGELSLPPEPVKVSEKPKAKVAEDEVVEIPQRRVRHFVVKAHLGEDDDINAESRKTLVIINNKGRENVLYVKR